MFVINYPMNAHRSDLIEVKERKTKSRLELFPAKQGCVCVCVF